MNQKTEKEEAFPGLMTNSSILQNPINSLFHHPLYSLINRPKNPLPPGFYNNPFLFFYNPLNRQNLILHNPFNAFNYLTRNFPRGENPVENSIYNLGVLIGTLSLTQTLKEALPLVPRPFPKL